jgi:hypothetical protein
VIYRISAARRTNAGGQRGRDRRRLTMVSNCGGDRALHPVRDHAVVLKSVQASVREDARVDLRYEVLAVPPAVA